MKRLGWPTCLEVRYSHLETSELPVGHGMRNDDLDTSGLAGQDKDLFFMGDDRNPPDLVD